MPKLVLNATLEKRGPAGAFVLDDAQVEQLGGGKKVFPVRLTVNGRSFALRLARMGGENLVGLRREVREEAGLAIGAKARIELALDETERTIEIPDDLAAALAKVPAVKKKLEAMSFTHKKEYVRWITEAKRAETRAARIEKAIAMIRAGEHR